MIFLGILIGIIILVAMIYMALSKQSNFTTRIASLIALAVMVVTVIICFSLILMSGKAPVDESVVYVIPPPPVESKGSNNIFVLMLLIIFMIMIFVLVFFLSLREHRKNSAVKEKAPDVLPDIGGF